MKKNILAECLILTLQLMKNLFFILKKNKKLQNKEQLNYKATTNIFSVLIGWKKENLEKLKNKFNCKMQIFLS